VLSRLFDELQAHKEMVDSEYLAQQQPLDITRSCLKWREARQGIDLVHDDVEKGLEKACSQ
jgi:hypothetical protein